MHAPENHCVQNIYPWNIMHSRGPLGYRYTRYLRRIFVVCFLWCVIYVDGFQNVVGNLIIAVEISKQHPTEYNCFYPLF